MRQWLFTSGAPAGWSRFPKTLDSLHLGRDTRCATTLPRTIDLCRSGVSASPLTSSIQHEQDVTVEVTGRRIRADVISASVRRHVEQARQTQRKNAYAGNARLSTCADEKLSSTSSHRSQTDVLGCNHEIFAQLANPTRAKSIR